MICSDCQTDNRAGRRFCSSCGSALSTVCLTCNFANEADDSFCGGCGASLREPAPQGRPPADAGPSIAKVDDGVDLNGAQAQRRQVTILFVDLVGFTEMSSRVSVEDLHSLLRRYFEAVHSVVLEYGGSIDKHIGDAVMALFGAPVAHDNDPERAVRAAMDIHAALKVLSVEIGKPVKAHVGIASGQVVASNIGGAAHSEYTVLGDSVNLAARLVDKSGAEETYLSDMVYQAVSRIVEADCVGSTSIKGLEAPVEIWRLLRMLETPSDNRLTPIFGRRSEIKQFGSMLENLHEIGHGQTVYVRGEAGIGKSRLIREFTELATSQGLATHTALNLDFGVGKGRGCIYSILRSLLDLPPEQQDNAEEKAAEWTIDASLIDPAKSMFLKDLLHIPQSREHRATYDAMDNETRNIGKRETVVALLRRISAETPLLIVIEDLHWADSVTLNHLANLAALTTSARFVLVMTSRFDGDPIDITWRQTAVSAPIVTIDLAPLSEAEAQSFAQEIFVATNRFTAKCIQRAQGNPMFLEQLLQSAEQINENDVPGSIQSLVLSRLDQLPSRDRQALQAAAVLGQRFASAVVQQLVEDLSWTPQELVQHRMVRPDGQEYSFSHALIWESVYATLLREQLQELHRRAADWFGSSDLGLKAGHLERAGSPNAAAAYLSAADQSAKKYHFEDGLAFSERGLAIVRDRGERHGLTMMRAECLRELGRPNESITAYEEALRAATTDILRCRAWIGMAASMRVVDEYDRALEMLDKAEKAADGDRRLAIELSNIHYYRGNIYFPLGNIEGCLEQHELALQHARSAGSADCEVRALSGLGDASYSQGRMITALDYFRGCVEMSEANGFGRIAVNNHYMVAWTRLYMMDVTGSCDAAELAVQSADQAGQLRAEMVARLAAGRTSLARADLKNSRRHLERGVEIATSLKANRFLPFFRIFSSRIDVLEGGSRTKIVEELQAAAAISQETGPGFVGPWVLSTLALAAADRNLRNQALKDGEKLLLAGCVGHNYFGFYADAMDVARQDADQEAVEYYANALEKYMAEEELPLARFYVDRARALSKFVQNPHDEGALDMLLGLKKIAANAELNSVIHAIDLTLADKA
jgi:class 3 adenylate cyclase/tetratricopeptide (TPR) repeat protein